MGNGHNPLANFGDKKAAPFAPGNQAASGLIKKRKRRVMSENYDEALQSPAPAAVVKALSKLTGFEDLPEGCTWAQLATRGLLRRVVMKGDAAAAKELREAIEGKAPQRIENIDPADRQINIRIVYAEPPKPRRRQVPALADGSSEDVIDLAPTENPQTTIPSGSDPSDKG